VSNPSYLWWGNGAEKVFVDGAALPTHVGTSTSDYFGFGSCSTEVFARPWFGKTLAEGPGAAGRTSLFRWHVAEAIPFTTELRFLLNLEIPSTRATTYLQEDAVTYWYAVPGDKTQKPAIDTAEFGFAPPSEVKPGGPMDTTRCPP